MDPKKDKKATVVDEDSNKANNNGACRCCRNGNHSKDKNFDLIDGNLKQSKTTTVAYCYRKEEDVQKVGNIVQSKSSFNSSYSSSSSSSSSSSRNNKKRSSDLLTSKMSNDVFGIHVLGFLDRKDIRHCMCVGKLHSKFHVKEYYCVLHGSRLESQTNRRQRLRRQLGLEVVDDASNNDDEEDNHNSNDDEQHASITGDDKDEHNQAGDKTAGRAGREVSEEVKAAKKKTPKLECEDCVEIEHGNERCPVCQHFADSEEEIVECDGCNARWCLPSCDDWPRGSCDECGKNSCGSDAADKEEQQGSCVPTYFCEDCHSSFCFDCRLSFQCEECDDDFICAECFMVNGYFCDHCNESYHRDCKDSYFCFECDTTFCYDCKDSYWCELCEETFCESCKRDFYCNDCEASHCYSCAKPRFCMECDSFVSCSEACTFFTCSECLTSTCHRCCTKSYACSDCGKEICADCQDCFKVCCCDKKGVFAVKRN